MALAGRLGDSVLLSKRTRSATGQRDAQGEDECGGNRKQPAEDIRYLLASPRLGRQLHGEDRNASHQMVVEIGE